MTSASQGMCPPFSVNTNPTCHSTTISKPSGRSCSNIKIAFSSGSRSNNSGSHSICDLGHAGGIGEGHLCKPKFSTMLYYSLDPQFAAFVFSLYARHERPSTLALFPDSLGCPTHTPAPSADLLSYAHAVGLQLLALGEHYACLFTQRKYKLISFLFWNL